ncbi:MAG TPA: trypsin-like peptidase domain-containing protein [Solirubrobacterales bacterium]|nr:trypsin-like peptidase domain-containing protein [Solirubrobacterales bacterium]
MLVEPAGPGVSAPLRIRRIREGGAGVSGGPRSSPDEFGLGDFKPGTVADPAAEGVRMHGRAFFKVPGEGNASCSGTAITSNRKNLVLTAGHCVHGGGYPAPWFKKWIFIPGYENGNAPYGVWEAKRLYSTGLWTEFAVPNADYALVVMRRLKGKRLQNVVGSRGIAFNRRPDQRYVSYGYPAQGNFDGETEHTCTAQLAGTDENTEKLPGPTTIRIGCDMTGGSSGGSWVINDRYAASLNSYGYPDLPDFMYGPQFTEVARDLYRAAQASCRGKVATQVGTNSKDRIVGTKRRDVIVGGGGGDVIVGKGGNDLICGGGGPDKLRGDAGKDALIGQSGGDRLAGGKGKDVCKGGRGKNRGAGCESKSRLR